MLNWLWLAEATFALTLRFVLLPSVTFSEAGARAVHGCYDVVVAEMVEVTPC